MINDTWSSAPSNAILGKLRRLNGLFLGLQTYFLCAIVIGATLDKILCVVPYRIMCVVPCRIYYTSPTFVTFSSILVQGSKRERESYSSFERLKSYYYSKSVWDVELKDYPRVG